ncbi:hypothetical protein K438DRAFT_1817212 [Mycena galopus ATCC 62051]|nr:hypothetical protein K438DRAFT_1817212 [Mycena galopus ATCC 62051]
MRAAHSSHNHVAFPFKISPSEAISQLASTSAGGGELFGASLNQRRLSLVVYFPAWFIDGEIEAKVNLSDATGHVTAVFLNSNAFTDKLSSVSFLSDNLGLTTEAVPFTAALETQWDTKITCLPFKTTPFSVLDAAAKSLKPDQCVISEVLALEPSSIRANLICAYPVLIPLYLAQYPSDRTVVLEAHDEEGRILEERAPDVDMRLPKEHQLESVRADIHKAIRIMGFPRTIGRFIEKFMQATDNKIDVLDAEIGGLFRYHRGGASPFVNIASLTIPPTWTPRWNYIHYHDFRRWLDGFRTTGTLPTTRNDSMVDPRVRPFTTDEVIAVRTFLHAGQERAKAHTVLESVSKVQQAHETRGYEALKTHAASLDTERQNATPSWWKEWQTSLTTKNNN